jgi:alpha-L-rhamnosidase
MGAATTHSSRKDPAMTAIPALDSLDSATTVVSLVPPYAAGLIGVPAVPLFVSWAVESTTPGSRQVAFELQASVHSDFSDAATTGPIASDNSISVLTPGGPLASREVRHVRVRIATDRGWTTWSAVLTVEAGLASADDWSAVAVGIDSEVGGPSPLLRREFTLREVPASARLHVTSLGLNEVAINGERVGAEFLSPGWSAYQGRLVVSTHDVTALLTEGVNAIGAALGDGWYRGRLGWEERDSLYGTELALLAQLEVTYADGSSERVVTDGDWRGSFGAVRASGIYDGTDIDLTLDQPGWATVGFNDAAWTAVHEVPLDLATLDLNAAPPVREVAQFAMPRLETSPGLVFDAGQNIAGWVRLVVRGTAGQTVTIRHAEVLEPVGSLHTRSLRSARAADVYVLGENGTGETTLEPVFTFHGFRYADVVTDATVVSLTGIAISSDTTARGEFESSEPALNRLHSNVVWSQRDNFVSVPTDCPQRDERLGWTGDAQAFATTSNTLFDTESFWRGWLKDLEIDQAPDGAVASVVPNILGPDAFKIADVGQNIMGRAGWADAASIVPWSLYESFGDLEPLRQQLSSMRRWVDSLAARRDATGLLPTEFQYGDWLDPDAPGSAPWAAKVSADFVANAFFARVARIQSWTETLVGDAEKSAHYATLGDEIAALTWQRFGEHAITTQTGCAIALEFSIAPDVERAAIAEALAANVRAENGRISTGFLGTPLVLHALSSTGHLDEAYLMLLCREIPSWLYQVEMGATTVWERWDALRADGSIHPGDMDNEEGAHMLSFNHYAYGAVIDWVYRTVAGLAPDVTNPGYRSVLVAPRPTASIGWARAAIETSLGRLSISWSITPASDLAIELVVPFGATADVDAPVTASSIVTINGVTGDASTTLGHGAYSIVVTNPAVAAA